MITFSGGRFPARHKFLRWRPDKIPRHVLNDQTESFTESRLGGVGLARSCLAGSTAITMLRNVGGMAAVGVRRRQAPRTQQPIRLPDGGCRPSERAGNFLQQPSNLADRCRIPGPATNDVRTMFKDGGAVSTNSGDGKHHAEMRRREAVKLSQVIGREPRRQTVTGFMAELPNKRVSGRRTASLRRISAWCCPFAEFVETRTTILKHRADVVVADLESTSVSEIAGLLQEFPALSLVCIHRLADDRLWPRRLPPAHSTAAILRHP